MARTRTGDASVDQLPWAYRKGHDKPIGWKAGARCHGGPRVTSPRKGGEPSIWQVEEAETYLAGDEPVKGFDLIAVALTYCSMCAVQWDCARYAVACEENFGVWSMPIDLLLVLRRSVNPEETIAAAEVAGTPMQFAVRDSDLT